MLTNRFFPLAQAFHAWEKKRDSASICHARSTGVLIVGEAGGPSERA